MYQIIELTPKLRVCHLSGDFDASAVSDHQLKDVFENLVSGWDGDIEVDLSDVHFMDSSGIGAIVFLFKRLNASARKLHLSGAVDQPLQLIEMLRLHKSIPMRPASYVSGTEVGQSAVRAER